MSRSPIALFVLAFACNLPNPEFDGPIGGSGTTGETDAGDELGSTGADETGSTSGAETSDSGSTESETTAAASSDSGGPDSDSSDSTDSGPTPGSVDYPATVTACRSDDNKLDPDECQAYAGASTMTVDVESDNGEYVMSFVAFELDDTLVDRTVTGVTLSLTTTDVSWAKSDSSGEIWRVEAFTHASLFGSLPAKMGGPPLAGEFGAVAPKQTVKWQLPNDTVGPSATLYIALSPLSSDGAHYWTLDGAMPPMLTVNYE